VTILVHVHVSYGAGHWMRIAALMQALASRHRVILAMRGTLSADLAVPAGVEVVVLDDRHDGSALADLVARERPRIVLVEYFPFGRHDAIGELLPLLAAARAASAFVASSVRDVQQCRRMNQQQFDARVCELANEHFDALLVHSDETLLPLAATFARTDALRVPVHHTGYVVPDTVAPRWSDNGAHRIVVSAGGGRGGEELLLNAIDAQHELAGDFRMRVIGGTYLDPATWAELEHRARTAPQLELLRWVPDLRKEMAAAAVSVSRCGYNTALDILRTGVPALVVPFATRTEDEQTRRAVKLSRRGALRQLAPEHADGKRLALEIRRTAAFRPSALEVDMNGAQRSLELLETACAS
jgi:predicted glycosyltransferase